MRTKTEVEKNNIRAGSCSWLLLILIIDFEQYVSPNRNYINAI